MTAPRPVVLVTGAAGGIGRACAIALGRDGCHVIAVDIAAEGAAQTASIIESKAGSAEHHHLDVTDVDAVDSMIEDTLTRHGRLDGAVNNAGISGPRVGVAELDNAGWESTRRLDLDAVFYCLRAEIRAMGKCGGGSIVNMGSVLSTVAFPKAAAYVAAKHGLLGLTRSAALDYAPEGIRVNAVGPGFVDTERHVTLPQEAHDELTALHPRGVLGQPEEIAELVAFLISDRSRNINGAFIPTDGGFTIR